MEKPKVKTPDPPAPAGGVFLERQRVDKILEKALQSHVVTVVAGEGNGKTYAVNSFLQRDPRSVIWIQMSERDNLGWRFWENYTGEIARLNPESAKILADLGFPESSRQFDRYLTLLKNEIISHKRYVVVFDDFHLLTNPSIVLFLERTFSAPVSKNNIVLVSRNEPALNTVPFLARGLLSQITVEDLKFSRNEVDEYFRIHHILLEEEELDRIFHETEGWALALGLILQEIKADQDAGKKRNWDRAMLPVKKMEENLFAEMDGELQKFLIKLSLIEHWPRDLLERLDGGGNHIDSMEKFSSVIRFDLYLHGFRIHPLFLDFLREKQGLLSREEIREVYRTGARWCIENNLPTDAAVDYERARDYRGLIRLIESLPRMLPRAVAFFFLETLDRLCAEPEEDGEDRDLLFLRFIIRPRILAFLDRFDESAEECHKALARFEAQPPSPDRSRILCTAYNALGILSILSCRSTRNYDFARWFEKGNHYYLENPEPVHEQKRQASIGSYVIMVGFPAKPGEIDLLIDSFSAAVPYASASLNGYLYGLDTLARAELAYYQGDLNRAEQFARQAVYQSREKKQYEVENRALFYLMRICIHTGNTPEIRNLERQMEAQLENSEYISRYTVHDTTMGRFYTRLGLTEKIAPWLKTENREEELNVLFRGFDSLVKARYLFKEKDYAGTLETLEEEKRRGDLGNFLLGMLETTALEAVTRFTLGDRKSAFESLKQAYDAASPHGLDMPFIELGEYMHTLVNAVLKTLPEEKDRPNAGGIPRNWLQDIRRKASAYAKTLSLVAAQYGDREESASGDFSDHELAVLNNLAEGFTGEKIAAVMHISVKMVNSAIRTLYTKLGAANRADAIRIAAARGLLNEPH